jgi:NRAMP (natural resistance-associated macrophage protein)-like metal ion transporter
MNSCEPSAPEGAMGSEPTASQYARPRGGLRSLGLGLIIGAADDDPSAIGTYAAAGAAYGPEILWTALAAFPMMFAIVFLCSKVGRVTGQGLFSVIRDQYSKPLLLFLLMITVVGNTVEAGADIGGMAASLNLLMPISPRALALGITAAVLILQLVGSYELIRNVFRWLALTLLAYLGSALLAHPALVPTFKGTFIPTIHFQRDFMLILVAVLGTTLSAYLYSWQSNQDVEEDLLAGRTPLRFRFRTTGRELRHSAYDLALGMFFSSLVMYFILLAASATLFATQHPIITTAADAAKALAPLAGKAASALFAVGVIGVGFIAVPIMTTGAAFDLEQSVGWRHGLHKRPSEAKRSTEPSSYSPLRRWVLISAASTP